MSDSGLHERASALFIALRELAEPERAAALERAGAEDPALATEVRSLFEHDVDAPDLETLPERIGPYRIVARIGRGGSGLVFLALQEEPVRRRLALKIVPQAALSPELSARFEVERRALERAEHPNIARILDAGRTPDGVPWIAMDLVEGPPITEYCRAHSLPLEARVQLVIAVAGAIQHAHQRGVIHRDLKPANVLVQEVDGRPVPRVVDFGIAKPVAGSDLATSARTSGLPVGTPAYMAPEQTGLGSVDTRADVYGLGAVLYELAAGRPPLERREHTDPLEALRRVREEIPSAASRAGAAEPALARATPALRADLDAVLARALEKDPERRYPTVAAFAEDLGRLLRCEPVEARPPKLGYRIVRFARRRRGLVLSLAGVAAALLVGTTGLVVGLVEAARGQRVAEDENLAQREINAFLEELIGSASPAEDGGRVPISTLLHRATERLDASLVERPVVAAALHQTLARTYAELGDYPRSEHHVGRALALRRAALGAEAADTLRSELLHVSLLVRREALNEALERYAVLLPRARLVLGPDDPMLYEALNDSGIALDSLGRGQEALTALEEALAGRARLLGSDDREVLVTSSNLALACEAIGQTERALRLLTDAITVAEASPRDQRFLLMGLENNLGALLQDLDRDLEAVPHLERAAELAGVVLGDDHPNTLTIRQNLAGLEAELGDPERAATLLAELVEQRTALLGPAAPDVLETRHGYWNALWQAERFDEAAEGFAELLDDVVAALGDGHPLAAQTRVSLARTLFDLGLPAEALPIAEQAAEGMATRFGETHSRTRSARHLVRSIRAQLGG